MIKEESRDKPIYPRRLPIVILSGIRYYRDDRLKEFRSVEDPYRVISFVELMG